MISDAPPTSEKTLETMMGRGRHFRARAVSACGRSSPRRSTGTRRRHRRVRVSSWPADSDSDDGAAPEEELAEERDVLEDQYAHEAKPMGKYEVRTMTVNDVKGRYRRYEKCELAWRNGKKVTVGFGWCIKVPFQRNEGGLADEILLSLCVVSEILVEELPRKKATEGETALGDVIFKVAWLYSLGELVNDFPQYVHHRSCLLYTSPSPRDATLSRMPSSA